MFCNFSCVNVELQLDVLSVEWENDIELMVMAAIASCTAHAVRNYAQIRNGHGSVRLFAKLRNYIVRVKTSMSPGKFMRTCQKVLLRC